MHGGPALARRASTPVLAILTWRDVSFSPVPDLDPSWHAAMHMAARRRLPYDELVFTFGPLGFLTQPVAYFPSTGLSSALYVFGLETALGAALVSALRRTVALPVAVLATFLLAGAARELKAAEVVVAVAVVTAIGLLRGDRSARTEGILVVAAGVVSGTHLLVKCNTGVIVTVGAVVTVWFVGRRTWRSEAVLLGTGLASAVAGWPFSGNRLGDLVPFFNRSLQVASGYSGLEEPLGTVEARVGDVVSVPDAGGRNVIVVARVKGFDASPLYGLRSTLWRLRPSTSLSMAAGGTAWCPARPPTGSSCGRLRPGWASPSRSPPSRPRPSGSSTVEASAWARRSPSSSWRCPC